MHLHKNWEEQRCVFKPLDHFLFLFHSSLGRPLRCNGMGGMGWVGGLISDGMRQDENKNTIGDSGFRLSDMLNIGYCDVMHDFK